MDKYEKLKELNSLKESGTLGEDEFKKEKEKILNEREVTKTKGNKIISIISFILSGIFLILTISFVLLSFHWYEQYDDAQMDYYMARNNYDSIKSSRYSYRYLYDDYKDEYEKAKERYDRLSSKYHFYEYARYVTGGLCIASLGIGFLFIERKKKNKKE